MKKRLSFTLLVFCTLATAEHAGPPRIDHPQVVTNLIQEWKIFAGVSQLIGKWKAAVALATLFEDWKKISDETNFPPSSVYTILRASLTSGKPVREVLSLYQDSAFGSLGMELNELRRKELIVEVAVLTGEPIKSVIERMAILKQKTGGFNMALSCMRLAAMTKKDPATIHNEALAIHQKIAVEPHLLYLDLDLLEYAHLKKIDPARDFNQIQKDFFSAHDKMKAHPSLTTKIMNVAALTGVSVSEIQDDLKRAPHRLSGMEALALIELAKLRMNQMP